MTALSPRQRQIVILVGRDGKQWKTVARELDISISTVRNHVATIISRSGTDRAPREAMVELYWREVLGRNGGPNRPWTVAPMDRIAHGP